MCVCRKKECVGYPRTIDSTLSTCLSKSRLRIYHHDPMQSFHCNNRYIYSAPKIDISIYAEGRKASTFLFFRESIDCQQSQYIYWQINKPGNTETTSLSHFPTIPNAHLTARHAPEFC